MREFLLVCALVAGGAACSSDIRQVIEPRPDFKSDTGCNVPMGVAKLGALFYALNQQDVGAVERLFPTSGDWELEIAPAIARSLAAGHLLADSEADRATSQAGIPSVVSSLAGLHLVFTVVPTGSAGPVDHVSPTGTVRINEVDLGPVNWEAVGPALEVRNKTRLRGGGKVAIACDSGLFIKVTLGAEAIE